MDPPSPQYDSYQPLGEREMQQLGQHYKEGTHPLDIEDFQRRHQEAPVFTAITSIHHDRRLDLEQEIKDLTTAYEKIKREEKLLKQHRDRLQAINRERNHPDEWTPEERNFVMSMSRMRPSLSERIQTVAAERTKIADESIAKNDDLGALNKRFNQARQSTPSAAGGRSLGRAEFFNNKRSTQEILYSIGEMLNNYHTVRYDRCLAIVVEAIGAFEEESRIRNCPQSRNEVRHFENLHRELLGLQRIHQQGDGSPFVTRFTLIHKMAEALATETLRMELQQRLHHDHKWGVKEIKASLTSNSFKPSPSASDKDKKKDSNVKDGKVGNKRKGKGGEAAPTDDKDKKKKKKSDLDCSLCGLSSGHTDSTCWKRHDIDESIKIITANRLKPEMKKHFKAIDNAKAKRDS